MTAKLEGIPKTQDGGSALEQVREAQVTGTPTSWCREAMLVKRCRVSDPLPGFFIRKEPDKTAMSAAPYSGCALRLSEFGSQPQQRLEPVSEFRAPKAKGSLG